jgi:hypothetical protein
MRWDGDQVGAIVKARTFSAAAHDSFEADSLFVARSNVNPGTSSSSLTALKSRCSCALALRSGARGIPIGPLLADEET